MLKAAIYIIGLILILIINRILMRKNKYFLPIIVFSCSVIIIAISIVQIIHKQNTDSTPSIQAFESSETAPEQEEIVDGNSVIITDSDIEVETKKSLFVVDLLRDFLLMNVPVGLCLLDKYLLKKNKK